MPRSNCRDPFQRIANVLPDGHNGQPVQIELVQVALSGQRVGESNPSTKYPDSVVAKARELKASGLSYKAVGLALGVPWTTVQNWIGRCAANAKRVTPAARIVAKRRA